jgi:TorA maturation chaperone TorD
LGGGLGWRFWKGGKEMDIDGKIKEKKQTIEIREHFYLFFSSLLLKPPEDNLIKQLLDPGCLKELSQYFEPEGIARLERYSQEYTISPEKLKQEHDDLFNVPLGKYVVPYESVYRDTWERKGMRKKGLLMGPSAQNVKSIYRRAGAELHENYAELPDHAGIELAFMHYLCQREKDAWQKDQPEEAIMWMKFEEKFVRDHLARWFPDLCDEITKKTRSDFYRGIAQLIKEFVLKEENMLIN